MNNSALISSGIILWFTGLSGSGKTTVAEGTLRMFQERGIRSRILDGDEIRSSKHRHLGFSEKDIKTNNKLIASLCAEERKRYDVVMVPIISPYGVSRSYARSKLSPGFHEIYFSVSVEWVRKRDVKGLYAKAACGEVKNMIGVSPTNPYEPPENADLVIYTEKETIQQATESLYCFALTHFIDNPHDTEGRH